MKLTVIKRGEKCLFMAIVPTAQKLPKVQLQVHEVCQGKNILILEAKSHSEHYIERERGGLLAQEYGLTLNFDIMNGCFKTAERVAL